MEDFNCSDSSSEMNGKDNLVCNKDFQRIMSMEGFDEEEEDIINTEETNYCRSIGKKKRLSMDQVQGLEKIFEVDSKLDQERKVKLAAELGLQPRQVAIWFQNRRARWKTKQLERDFRLLKANYESLQQNYSQIEREKEGLVAELRGLKEKLGEENCEEKGSTENQQVYNYTNYKQTEDLKERLLILASSDNSTAGFILNDDTSSRLLSDDHNGLIIMDDLSASAATTATTSSSSSLMDSSSRGEMMMRGGYCYYDDDHHHHQQQQQQQKDILKSNGDESCSMTMMMPPLPFDQTPFFWYNRI